MFDGLMSRWIRPAGVGLAQGLADLAQQVHRPPGRQRAVALDQLGQAQPLQDSMT